MTDEAQELPPNACAKCRFWVKKWDGFPPVMGVPARETMGECHRYPPEPAVGNAEVTIHWPMTRNYDFCGDHRE